MLSSWLTILLMEVTMNNPPSWLVMVHEVCTTHHHYAQNKSMCVQRHTCNAFFFAYHIGAALSLVIDKSLHCYVTHHLGSSNQHITILR